MAPLIAQAAELAKRAGGCGDDRYRGSDGGCYWYNYHSGWYYWGRWVFAGLAILFIIITFAILFRNSRRRRKLGRQPLRGTGWMAPAPPPYYPPPPQYSAQDQNPGAPPPPAATSTAPVMDTTAGTSSRRASSSSSPPTRTTAAPTRTMRLLPDPRRMRPGRTRDKVLGVLGGCEGNGEG